MHSTSAPAESAEHNLALSESNAESSPLRIYYCNLRCPYIYDERTGVCSVCLRKILFGQTELPIAAPLSAACFDRRGMTLLRRQAHH